MCCAGYLDEPGYRKMMTNFQQTCGTLRSLFVYQDGFDGHFSTICDDLGISGVESENKAAFDSIIANMEGLDGPDLLRNVHALDVQNVRKALAHKEVPVASGLKKGQVLDLLFEALPQEVVRKLREAENAKAQAQEVHHMAVSTQLDLLRQQLAGLPLEDLLKRTKVVSEIGVEDLKHLLSFVGVDCKKMKKQELVSRLQQHLEQQATQATQDPA